jgi:transcription elongation factor S-II
MTTKSTELRQRARDYFQMRFTEGQCEAAISEVHATNLEKGIYNYAIREASQRKVVKSWDNIHFYQLYLNRLRSIYFNLSLSIIGAIQSGALKAQEFAFMTHQEMCPENWKSLMENKQKRADNQTTNFQCTTDLFTCKKCSSKHCTYYEMQIRSADEPATIFVSCLDCGKHWRC